MKMFTKTLTTALAVSFVSLAAVATVRADDENRRTKLTFSQPLPQQNAAADRFRVARWNYRWSGEYGSKRWKVSDPRKEGQDEVPVRGAELSADGRTLTLTLDDVRPVMQMQVGYNLTHADGRRVTGSVYLTVNPTAVER